MALGRWVNGSAQVVVNVAADALLLYRVRLASLPWVGLGLDETHPFGIAR